MMLAPWVSKLDGVGMAAAQKKKRPFSAIKAENDRKRYEAMMVSTSAVMVSPFRFAWFLYGYRNFFHYIMYLWQKYVFMQLSTLFQKFPFGSYAKASLLRKYPLQE